MALFLSTLIKEQRNPSIICPKWKTYFTLRIFYRSGGMTLEDTLKVGEIAPAFTLPATTKETISLSDYKGKKNVVVAFYGMDFTPG